MYIVKTHTRTHTRARARAHAHTHTLTHFCKSSVFTVSWSSASMRSYSLELDFDMEDPST